MMSLLFYYLGQNKPGVLVQFETIREGFLYEEFTEKLRYNLKPENGCLSYGLGLKGSISSEKYKKRDYIT
jgi:hypothetical protein